MKVFLLTGCGTPTQFELGAEDVLGSGWPYPSLEHAQNAQNREWRIWHDEDWLGALGTQEALDAKYQPPQWERHTDGVWWAHHLALGHVAHIREFEWSGDAPGRPDAGWFQVKPDYGAGTDDDV